MNNSGFICEWNSKLLASSADLIEDYWFTDAAIAEVSDIDSLMGELPTANISVDEFLTGTADDSRNLLNDAVFASSSTKK